MGTVSSLARGDGDSRRRGLIGEKADETSELRAFIEMLDLRDAVVSICASGCQRPGALPIRRNEAEAVPSAWGNQPRLRADLQLPTTWPSGWVTPERGR
jgi:hypothetical protein